LASNILWRVKYLKLCFSSQRMTSLRGPLAQIVSVVTSLASGRGGVEPVGLEVAAEILGLALEDRC